jgi:hypothetical protein
VVTSTLQGRFHAYYEPDRTPHTVGLCVECLRTMWVNIPEDDRAGKVLVSGDGRRCQQCVRFIRQHGYSPQLHRGSPAERVPAEGTEDEQWWRDPALTRCTGIGVEPFAPDPMPGDGAPTTWAMRRYVAAFVCSKCPVAAPCRAAARVHGYEGLWGGRFFQRNTWVDVLTGVRGPTKHAGEPTRSRMLARLAERGYDENGEKIKRTGVVA